MTTAENIRNLFADRDKGVANLAAKGVNISATAGISEIMDKILDITGESVTGTIINNSVAFLKTVPSNSTKFCYLNSIGGMSYVSETLTATPDNDGWYYLTYTRPPDYVPGEDGSGTFDIYSPVCPFGFLVPENVSDDGVTISGYFSLRKTAESEAVDNNPVIPYIPAFARNVDINKRMFPENYFSGLRHAKPTAVRSYGSNVLDFEAALAYWGSKGLGFTYVISGDEYQITSRMNAGYSHPYVFTDKPDIYTISATYIHSEGVTNPCIELGYWDDSFTSANQFVAKGRFSLTDLASVTSTGECNAIRLNFSSVAANTLVEITEIRINRGTTDYGFKPYREPITYNLPTAITDKLGLGYDADLFNEYSFVEGEAIERLNSTVISGTAGWFGIVNGRDRVGYALPSDAISIVSNQNLLKANLLTPYFGNDYSIKQLNDPFGYVWQVGGMHHNAGAHAWFYFPQDTFSTKEEAEAWFDDKQMPIVYEKVEYIRTPITTDFDPLIQVEAGGYIEFVNEYGYAVPSTVTFTIVSE